MRALVVIACGALASGALLYYVAGPLIRYFTQKLDSGDFELAYFPEQRKMLFGKHGTSVVYVAVPASAGWMATGVRVRPDKSVRIKAVGQVNLALKELELAVAEDRRPRFPWYDPDGSECKAPSEGPNSCNFALLPGENIGRLVAYLRPLGSPAPSFSNPRPSGIQSVGADSTVTNASPHLDADLFLAVNDLVLSNSNDARAVYLAGHTGEHLQQKEVQWGRLVESQYWNVWFDDNIGQYLVQVDASEK